MAEVRGSSPLSSTVESAMPEAVGMDCFYARLAHHVRTAEAGGEVVVTRRGRPVARLVPYDLNLAVAGADA
ncbi:MAG: type II toxin-antitoxin system prevent-host-death family antitoxin [Actinobacteria bacterium]|nr:type II toxin-antitoxin system prevent-host-death family antitoxin [Actinomycetota bacterium]